MNEYRGMVVDMNSGAPLQGVTIAIDQTPVGVTDQAGSFDIKTTLQGQDMGFSYVGYNTQLFPIDQINDLAQIALLQNIQGSTLPGVTVTPTAAQTARVASFKSYIPYVLAGGALLLLSGKGKKKVGGVATNEILIAGAAAVAAYFIFKSFSRPAVQPAYQPVYSPAYLQQQAAAANPVASDISAGGAAASSILTAISNF